MTLLNRSLLKDRILLLISLAVLFIGLINCQDQQQPRPSSLPLGDSLSFSAVIKANEPKRPRWVTTVDTVRRGDTFNNVLLRNRLYLRDIGRAVKEIKAQDLFSLRKIKPGEQIQISVNDGGFLRRIQYQKSPDQIYVVRCWDDSIHAYETGLPYDIYLRKLSGTLETTIYEIIHSAGGNDRLVHKLSDIFESDIDFITEPRPGDRLSLLVEEKRFQGEWVGQGAIVYASYEGKKVSQTAIYFPVKDTEGSQYFSPEGESLTRIFLRSPLNYRRISSRFSRSRRHPILRVYRPHLGVDYAAPNGTPVVAIGDGTVDFAGWNGGFGRFVRLRHGAVYETYYGHFSRIARGIKKSIRVKRGQIIGYVGSSGLSTGPHLDFRVKRHGEFIDPLKMDNPTAAPLPDLLVEEFAQHRDYLKTICDSLESGRNLLWQAAPADSSNRGEALVLLDGN